MRSRQVADAVDCPLQLLLETARGLMAAQDLAVAHPLGGRDRARRGRPRRRPAGGPDWPGLGSGWVVAVARRPASRRRSRASTPTSATWLASGPPRPPAGTTGSSAAPWSTPSRSSPSTRCTGRPPTRSAAHRTWSTPTTEHGRVARQQPCTLDGRFVDPAVVAGAQLTLRLAALDSTTSSTTSTSTTSTEENR